MRKAHGITGHKLPIFAIVTMMAVCLVACIGRQREDMPAAVAPSSSPPVETLAHTPSAAPITATPMPTPEPLSPRQEMAAIAALAETAMPWNAYTNLPEDLLAPFAAQLERDFNLYGRMLSQGTDEPAFYILLKPKEHYAVPEIGTWLSRPGWRALEDREGNEFIRVYGADHLSFHDGYGMIFCYSEAQIDRNMLPPVQDAIQDAELLQRNISQRIYPIQPQGETTLSYSGYFRLDAAIQRELNTTISVAKTAKIFDIEHPGDSRLYPLPIFMNMTLHGEEELLMLLSDGSVLLKGRLLLNDEETRGVVNRALDAFRSVTGIDPRGFDFDRFTGSLVRAELTMPIVDGETGETRNEHTQVIADPDALTLLMKQFHGANRNGDGKCPFRGEMTLYPVSGDPIEILLATDSCSSAHILHGGSYIAIDYGSYTGSRAAMESIFFEMPWR